MRLINEDKAKYSLWGFERYTGIDEMPIEYAEEIIDKQPTVEAIPIEWIKNWFNPKYASTVYYSLLRDMIKDWEKENEIN